MHALWGEAIDCQAEALKDVRLYGIYATYLLSSAEKRVSLYSTNEFLEDLAPINIIMLY